MTKKTRFKIAVTLLIFLMGIVVYSLSLGLTEITGQSISALMVVASTYVLGDSYRKSSS